MNRADAAPPGDESAEAVAGTCGPRSIRRAARRHEPGRHAWAPQGWHDGRVTEQQRTRCTLGGPLPGVLQEYIVIPAQDAVAAPAELSDDECATLPQSVAATAFGSFVGVVGFVAGYEAKLNIRQLIGPTLRLQGIAVGSRAHLQDLLRAMQASAIRPVIDSRFALTDAQAAFRQLAGGSHFGKVVVQL